MKKEFYSQFGTWAGTATVVGRDWQSGETALALSRAQYVTKSQDVAVADRVSELLSAPTIQAVPTESK